MASPPRARDAGLVLRRIPYGESSLVCQVFTREHGRVTVLAKGAYRPKSGYFAVLDLFDTLRLGWRPRAAGGLALLAEASIATRRRGLSADLDRYRAALTILELTGLGGREGEADPALFDLAAGFLDLLDAGRVDPEVCRLAFELRFLAALGLAPALDHCASCGVPEGAGREAEHGRAGEVAFEPAAGGRLCARCAEALAARRTVARAPLHLVRVARSLMRSPPSTLPNVRLAEPQGRGVRDLVHRFLEYHLETRPRSFGPARLARGRPRRTPRALRR